MGTNWLKMVKGFQRASICFFFIFSLKYNEAKQNCPPPYGKSSKKIQRGDSLKPSVNKKCVSGIYIDGNLNGGKFKTIKW